MNEINKDDLEYTLNVKMKLKAGGTVRTRIVGFECSNPLYKPSLLIERGKESWIVSIEDINQNGFDAHRDDDVSVYDENEEPINKASRAYF